MVISYLRSKELASYPELSSMGLLLLLSGSNLPAVINNIGLIGVLQRTHAQGKIHLSNKTFFTIIKYLHLLYPRWREDWGCVMRRPCVSEQDRNPLPSVWKFFLIWKYQSFQISVKMRYIILGKCLDFYRKDIFERSFLCIVMVRIRKKYLVSGKVLWNLPLPLWEFQRRCWFLGAHPQPRPPPAWPLPPPSVLRPPHPPHQWQAPVFWGSIASPSLHWHSFCHYQSWPQQPINKENGLLFIIIFSSVNSPPPQGFCTVN